MKDRLAATTAMAATSHGRGAGRSTGARGRRPTAKAAAINAVVAAAVPAICGTVARNCSVWSRKITVAPRRKTTTVTVRPARPSHGVVRRSGTRVSTTAMGTAMLQTAWPPTNVVAQWALMPRAGTWAALWKS
jgi:hypothetical protein